MKNKEINFDTVYTNAIDLLKDKKITYLIIGGLAVGVLGEARMTQDIDILIKIGKDDLLKFLRAATQRDFGVDVKKAMKSVGLQGFFRLTMGDFHIDFIIGSMPFEVEAFKRKRRIKLYNRYASFPTPEDLILFKIIPGREKDMLDAKTVAIRHKNKLDIAYLKKWTQIISDDLENTGVYRRLEEVLRATD